MTEELRNGLRWVLLTTDEGWRAELEEVFSKCSVGQQELREIETMLEGSKGAAAAVYLDRIDAMLTVVRQKMIGSGGDGVEELAQNYARLDDEVESLEKALAERRAALAEVSRRLVQVLEPGKTVELGRYQFERIERRTELVVDDAAAVSPELCSPSPDPKKLERAWKIRGDAPIGTRVVVVDARLDVFRIA